MQGSYPIGPAGCMVTRRTFFSVAGGAVAACVGGIVVKNQLDGQSRQSHLHSLAGRVGATHGPGMATEEKFLELVRCGTRILYVSGQGSDSNPGTERAPFREIHTAVHHAIPGDLILVGSGVYGYTEVSGFHGSPDAWLGIMARSDQAQAVISVPPPTDNFLNITNSSYVGLYGFQVAGDQKNSNTNCSGISVHGGSHHVVLWNNHVHDFPGGGINCFDAGGSHDLIDISYNKIHGTSRHSPENTSGISIYAAQDLTQGELLPGGYGYRVVGNYIFDVECLVEFRRGGFDYVTDGNGISLDLIEKTYGYRKPILVENNIITGCGGRAVHAFGTVNTEVVRNTAVGNMRTRSPAISGGAEMNGTVDDSVRFVRNVICPLNTPSSTDAVSTYEENVFLGGTQSVPPRNTDLRDWGLSYFAGPLTPAELIDGTDPTAFRAADS
jgi:hypothetical protein